MQRRAPRHAQVVVTLDAVQDVFVELVEVRHSPVASTLEEQGVLPPLKLEPSHLTPIGAPAIPNNPVLRAVLGLAPTRHLHFVVNVGLVVPGAVAENAVLQHARILGVAMHEVPGSDAGAGDGAAGVDFFHHCRLPGDVAVAPHAVADESRLAPAGARGKGGRRVVRAEAVPADIHRRAFLVDRSIGYARLVRHLLFLHEAVDHPGIAAVTAGGRADSVGGGDAVQERLSRKHHVREARLAHDLNAIVQR
mmetsp:Transcript_115955/g.328156  ORF Transcript_115955/g.328156 Transcript_115955/m.328156 type:complete len:250 (-) Transcript_115955:374-1123(-)